MHQPIAPIRSFHVRLRSQIVESSAQVARSAVFGDTPHQFVRQVRRGSDLAAIKVHGERDIALVGEFGGLLFYPVIQSPPFVDHDEGRERALSGRCVQHAGHGIVAGFVGDRFTVGGQGGEGNEEKQREQKSFHAATSTV